MKKLKRKVINNLPDFLIGYKIRNKISIPEAPVPECEFKVATEKEELEEAYALLYKAYLGKKFIDKKKSGLHLMRQHAHPLTVTLVGKINGKVVITASVFPDSELGLPMDSLYKKELDKLRKQGRFIAEVGSLASAPEVRRGSHHLPMMMNNIVHRYAKDNMGADDLVITVNPLHEFVYKHVILFKRIGKVKPYQTVKGHLAVPMRLDLHTVESRHIKTYAKKPKSKNFHRFFFVKQYDNIKLPIAGIPNLGFNESLYQEFFIKRSEVDRVDFTKDQAVIAKLYAKYYGQVKGTPTFVARKKIA